MAAKQQTGRVKIGMEVARIPVTICETDDAEKGRPLPMWGRVTYIHPRGLFHTVAFQVRGGIIWESFQGVEV